jgi:hypothetical protein
MKPKKVSTPGTYQLKGKKARKRKAGRPVTPKSSKRARKVKHRDGYTKADMEEAIGLVQEEGYCIKVAAAHTNDIKLNTDPRMTLSDRLWKDNDPKLGRPVDLAPAVEESLV